MVNLNNDNDNVREKTCFVKKVVAKIFEDVVKYRNGVFSSICKNQQISGKKKIRCKQKLLISLFPRIENRCKIDIPIKRFFFWN